jgi:hypothetical protein
LYPSADLKTSVSILTLTVSPSKTSSTLTNLVKRLRWYQSECASICLYTAVEGAQTPHMYDMDVGAV